MIDSLKKHLCSRERYLLTIIAVAAVVSMYTYESLWSRGETKIVEDSAHDSRLVLGLTAGFVQAYSEFEAEFTSELMPNSARYRAHAMNLSDLSSALGDAMTSDVYGFSGKSVYEKNTSDTLKRKMRAMENTSPPTASTFVTQNGDQTVHSTVWPYYAKDQGCVNCHNSLLSRSSDFEWQLGDLMGAQVIERNITDQLEALERQSLGVSVLVFFIVITVLYSASILMRQVTLTKELQKLATVDTLTGCLNRREAQSRANNFDESVSGAVLMLDIDHFKNINDTFGHSAGDRIIKDTSDNVKAALRKSDWVARVGGEEFLVWLAGVSYEDAITIAERIRSQCASSRTTFGTRTVAYTVSIGVHAVTNAKPSNFDEWVYAADTRLYQAKGAGRNRIIGLQPV